MQPAGDVLVIGQSIRTGPAAVEKLTNWLAEHTQRETHLFLVILPEPLDHLDTVFTMVSQDECTVFPQALFGHGPESVNVLQVTLQPGREAPSARRAELLPALGEVLGKPLHAIWCGGENPVEQRREQWWGGASILAVAPGKLISFRNPQQTLAALQARGYECLESEHVLSGRQDPANYEKCVTLIKGAELSRAKGGPRSLVLPLLRDCA